MADERLVKYDKSKVSPGVQGFIDAMLSDQDAKTRFATAREIFAEIEKEFRERFVPEAKLHPDLSWYNWWHLIKSRYNEYICP